MATYRSWYAKIRYKSLILFTKSQTGRTIRDDRYMWHSVTIVTSWLYPTDRPSLMTIATQSPWNTCRDYGKP